jgi:hypothetical protein
MGFSQNRFLAISSVYRSGAAWLLPEILAAKIPIGMGPSR